MFETLLGILKSGLGIWAAREKNFPTRARLDMLERLHDMEDEYRAEMRKPVGVRNNAVVDNAERELCKLAADFATLFGGAQPGDKPPSA